MRNLIISNCKINIGLNVTEILPNGYHSLDMVMAPVDLADKIYVEFRKRQGELKIHSNDLKIPKGKENILHKIYSRYYDAVNLPPQEIDVYIEKNIPMEAGLGGGSSNGAMFLKELNDFHGELLDEKELIALAKSVGADLPFFLVNSFARVRGIGEEIETFESRLDCRVILVKPHFGISTPEAFKAFDRLKHSEAEIEDANIREIVDGIKTGDLTRVTSHIQNHLEEGLLRENHEIIHFRKRLESFWNCRFFMSGSGSTYFTLVSHEEAEEKFNVLKDGLKDCKVYLCSFL